MQNDKRRNLFSSPARRDNFFLSLGLMLPTILIVLIIAIYPLIKSFDISLRYFNLMKPEKRNAIRLVEKLSIRLNRPEILAKRPIHRDFYNSIRSACFILCPGNRAAVEPKIPGQNRAVRRFLPRGVREARETMPGGVVPPRRGRQHDIRLRRVSRVRDVPYRLW